ncbi:MAG: zinc ABC transporter substrate-binding protein [Planctomycetes bacterium]|nr:zinc ABC transporter substrate-binding protein [Planctomycetota bacterium]
MNQIISPRAPFWVLLVATTLSTLSCGPGEGKQDSGADGNTNGKPQVYVVNYPLKYFAERIGGDLVDVHFPAPADVDPAFWKPEPQIVNDFQSADLILLNGAKYAKWVERASLSQTKLVNTTDAVSEQYIKVEDAITHQHGPTGEHTHKGLAFTTWLDPKIAIEQARAVKDALVKQLPDQKVELEKRFSELAKELQALDKRLEQIVAGKQDTPLFASHPVYQYLSRRYQLNVKSVHWEPDTTPDEEAFEELTKLAAKHPAKWMLWEAEPTAKTIEILKSRGIQTIVFEPSGNTPASGDYRTNMIENATRLESAFAGQRQE